MSNVDLKPLIGAAGQELVRVAQAVRDDDLSAATPCHKYDVSALLNHLLYWAPVFELAARKEPVPADRPSEDDSDLAVGDWRTLLAKEVDSLTTAWADPAAWEGMTSIGRSDLGDLPAAFVGSLVLTEFAMHGWDLARAVGASYESDPAVAAAAYGILAETADHGRASGAFGPEVTVSPEAPMFERALGVSGRDPHWAARAQG